jgi:hypothetical protein
MNHPEVITRKSQTYHQLNGFLSICLLCAVAALTISCGRSEPKQPDLAKQPDRWVNLIVLDADSKAKYIGKTKNYVITKVSSNYDLDGLRTVSVGDEIEGVRIGAIKCSFFWRDASYGGGQFMWRGRWGCQAGRSRQEIENSVGKDGEKHFDYVYVSPVRL